MQCNYCLMSSIVVVLLASLDLVGYISASQKDFPMALDDLQMKLADCVHQDFIPSSTFSAYRYVTLYFSNLLKCGVALKISQGRNGSGLKWAR